MKKFLDFFKDNSKEIFIFILLLALAVRFAISFPYYSGDVTNHLRWGKSIAELGTFGFYFRDFSPHAFQTYPPIGMLPFAFSILFYNFFLKVIWVLNLLVPPFPSNLVFFFQDEHVLFAFLKLPAILGDLGVAYFLFRFSQKFTKERFFDVLIPSLYLFNPAVFYLSSNWGQIESLPIFFAMGAFFYLFERRPKASIIFLTLSLLSKQTAVIFIPLYVIIFWKLFNFKKSLFAIATGLFLLWLFYLPFGFLNPKDTILFYLKTFSYVTDRIYENAFNIWMFVFGFEKPRDLENFLGLTLRLWGYLGFIILSIPTFFLFFKKPEAKITLSLLAYLVLVAFLFLTRMHERYLALSLPFLLSAAIFWRPFFVVYLVFSLTHFINLYNGFFQPQIPSLTSLLSKVEFVRLLIILNLFVFLVVVIFFSKLSLSQLKNRAKT